MYLANVFQKRRNVQYFPTSYSSNGSRIPFLSKQTVDLTEVFLSPNFDPSHHVSLCHTDVMPALDGDNGRYQLAILLSQHPNTAVRKALVQIVKHLLPPLLFDLLKDEDEDVQLRAAKAIWDMADTCPTYLLKAFCYLRNELQRTGITEETNLHSKALQTLNVLCRALPHRQAVCDRWLAYTWCYGDVELTEYAQQLIQLHHQYGSFLNHGQDAVSAIGRRIDAIGLTAMQLVYEVIWLSLCAASAAELSSVWSGIGRWKHAPTH